MHGLIIRFRNWGRFKERLDFSTLNFLDEGGEVFSGNFAVESKLLNFFTEEKYLRSLLSINSNIFSKSFKKTMAIILG